MNATRYDEWFEKGWGRYAFEIERDALRRAAGPLEARRVLDVGCGTGRFTAVAEERAAWVVGIDADPDMLDIAATKLHSPLLVADAHELPFVEAAFDVTTAVTLCEFTANPRHVVAEMLRVTRPGGRAVVGSLNPRSPWGLARRRSLHRPPWTAAHFLDRRALAALGRPQGRISITGSLFAPGRAPRNRRRAERLEAIGRKLLAGFGAFQVLAIGSDAHSEETAAVPRK